MQLMTGLKGTLFPEGDKTLATPDQLLLGNPAKPDKEKSGEAANAGGKTFVRTESSIDDKRELLTNLMENADSDDVESIDPRLSDLNDDNVVRLIEDAKYDEALDLIEDNRADKEEEAEGSEKPKGEDGGVSKAKPAADDGNGEAVEDASIADAKAPADDKEPE